MVPQSYIVSISFDSQRQYCQYLPIKILAPTRLSILFLGCNNGGILDLSIQKKIPHDPHIASRRL